MQMDNYNSAPKKTNRKITCSVVGARGYTGLEIVRLLLNHPEVELKSCFATSTFQIEQYIDHEKLSGVVCLSDADMIRVYTVAKPDLVFLATPAEVSMVLAPKLLAMGIKVIDLSGAFRLKTHDYKKWYGLEHNSESLLGAAVYGLVPWMKPFAAGESPTLVSNPGCFATAVSMAAIPLLKADLLRDSSLVVDAKSGTSGGGRKASENLLFTEVDGECLPYKIGKHQHYPEILEAISNFSGRSSDLQLTTSLLPTRRGIIAGIYAKLNSGKSIADVEAAFMQSYSTYSLVRFGSIGKNPHLLSLKRVIGTARTHISYEVEGNRLYLFSCIDNLLKGAASQAVENMNWCFDLPITTGLEQLEAMT